MKKVHILIVLTSLVCALFVGCKKSSKAKVDPARLQEVIVYTYDSFCGEWGISAHADLSGWNQNVEPVPYFILIVSFL